MSITPFFRSPFTDITGTMLNSQLGPCGKMELKFIECLEAYGAERGVREPKCVALMEDFYECETHHKKRERVFRMRWERVRQYYTGESEQLFAPPPRVDAS